MCRAVNLGCRIILSITLLIGLCGCLPTMTVNTANTDEPQSTDSLSESEDGVPPTPEAFDFKFRFPEGGSEP